MRRQLAITAAGLATGVTLAACSGSSGGTHTQSLSSRPTGTSTMSSSAPGISTSPTTSPSDPRSTTSAATSTVPVATPSVKPAGQGAVNAYVGLINVTTKLGADPPHANMTELAPYVTAATLPQWRQIFSNMAKEHLAYRGNADDPNLKLISATGQSAALSSCPSPARTNPLVQYNVLTGKVIKTTGGPYLKAITVVFTAGRWRVSGIASDTSKTCSP